MNGKHSAPLCRIKAPLSQQPMTAIVKLGPPKAWPWVEAVIAAAMIIGLYLVVQ